MISFILLCEYLLPRYDDKLPTWKTSSELRKFKNYPSSIVPEAHCSHVDVNLCVILPSLQRRVRCFESDNVCNKSKIILVHLQILSAGLVSLWTLPTGHVTLFLTSSNLHYWRWWHNCCKLNRFSALTGKISFILLNPKFLREIKRNILASLPSRPAGNNELPTFPNIRSVHTSSFIPKFMSIYSILQVTGHPFSPSLYPTCQILGAWAVSNNDQKSFIVNHNHTLQQSCTADGRNVAKTCITYIHSVILQKRFNPQILSSYVPIFTIQMRVRNTNKT